MRALVFTTSVLVSLAACRSGEPPTSTSTPASRPSAAMIASDANDDRRLLEITKELEASGPSGTMAGELLEKRGEILERNGKLADAARAYDEAARAYNQSPEATSMPVVRSDRAKERASAVRARMPK